MANTEDKLNTIINIYLGREISSPQTENLSLSPEDFELSKTEKEFSNNFKTDFLKLKKFIDKTYTEQASELIITTLLNNLERESFPQDFSKVNLICVLYF